jgi:hypothetical protein
MPEGRQSWQNLHVRWVGEITEISAPPHGIRAFSDAACGRTILLRYPPNVMSFYRPTRPYDGYEAAATFAVSGRLEIHDAKIWLSLVSAQRRSRWTNGQQFYDKIDAQMRKRDRNQRRSLN